MSAQFPSTSFHPKRKAMYRKLVPHEPPQISPTRKAISSTLQSGPILPLVSRRGRNIADKFPLDEKLSRNPYGKSGRRTGASSSRRSNSNIAQGKWKRDNAMKAVSIPEASYGREFFLACFSMRFCFCVFCGSFLASRLPLSLLPLSPMAVAPEN
jgi:hypothetical protein